MKILKLEDELAAQLRNAVGGREEIEVARFNEDEVLALVAVCARVCALIGMRDMCGWVEDSEGGKQSCVWDIISALVEWGRMGYREEKRVSSFFLSI
jgi:cohesin complex subunit SA-1/2